MSVVAVKIEGNTITIGADSILVSRYTQEKQSNAKLHKISNDFAIGAVGLCKDGTLLAMYSKSKQPRDLTEFGVLDFFTEFLEFARKKTGDGGYNLFESQFILVYQKKVFFFENFLIREIKDYYAIGAGRDYALAALYLGSSVEDAIKTSCHLSIYCEEPINIIKL